MQEGEQNKLKGRWVALIRRQTTLYNFALFLSKYRFEGLAWFWFAALCLIFSRLSGENQLSLIVFLTSSTIWFGVCLWRFMRFKFNPDEVREMMDRKLEMHHALHCADRGIGQWPDENTLEKAEHQVKFNAKPFLSPFSFGVLALLLAWVWPITTEVHAIHKNVNSWQMEEIEEKIEELEKDDYLDEVVLEKWKEQLEDLQSDHQDEQDHAAMLEAGDRLESQIDGAVSKVEQVLEQMSYQVSMMSGNPSDNSLSEQQKKQQDKRLSDLLKKAKEMQLSWQPPADCRKPGDGSQNSKNFSQNQLEKLSKALEQSMGSCSSCLGESDKPGQGKGQKPGKGGIKRGRGDAEMSYSKPTAPIPLSKLEALPEANEMSLGEKLDSQYRAPNQEDKSTTLKATGQKAADSDRAAGVIWKMKLRPDERQFLYRQSNE